MLNQPLSLFHHDLGDLCMPLGRFIKRGTDYFSTFDLPLPIRHFFRALINQQDNQQNLRMIVQDGTGNGLKQHGFPRPRSSHDEPALPPANGRGQFHDPRAVLLLVELDLNVLVGIERGQVVEQNFIPLNFRFVVINFFDF